MRRVTQMTFGKLPCFERFSPRGLALESRPFVRSVHSALAGLLRDLVLLRAARWCQCATGARSKLLIPKLLHLWALHS
jgi:hypothetical protein